jgi:hypothetical protein
MHLVFVFDMDETLVSTGPATIDAAGALVHAAPIARPFLVTLFEAVFRERADVVGIWTAASRDWFERVYESIFASALATASERLGRPCHFAFVYTREHCTPRRCSLFDDDPLCRVKKLRMLWRRHRFGASRHNTLVFDDTPHTFAHNYGNAVPVPAYEPVANDLHLFPEARHLSRIYRPEHDKDNVLLALSSYLETLRRVHAAHGTVRRLEKRTWLPETRLAAAIPEEPADDDDADGRWP